MAYSAWAPANPEWTSTDELMPGNSVESKFVMKMSASVRRGRLYNKYRLNHLSFNASEVRTTRSYLYPDGKRRPSRESGRSQRTLSACQLPKANVDKVPLTELNGITVPTRRNRFEGWVRGASGATIPCECFGRRAIACSCVELIRLEARHGAGGDRCDALARLERWSSVHGCGSEECDRESGGEHRGLRSEVTCTSERSCLAIQQVPSCCLYIPLCSVRRRDGEYMIDGLRRRTDGHMLVL